MKTLQQSLNQGDNNEVGKDPRQGRRHHKHLQMQDDTATPPPAPPSRSNIAGHSPRQREEDQPPLEKVQRKFSVGLLPPVRRSTDKTPEASHPRHGAQTPSQTDGVYRTSTTSAKAGNKFGQGRHGRREGSNRGAQQQAVNLSSPQTSRKVRDEKQSPLALAGSVYEENSQPRDTNGSDGDRQSAEVQPGAVRIPGFESSNNYANEAEEDEEYGDINHSSSVDTNDVPPNTEREATNVVTSAQLVDQDQERMQIEAELRQTIQNELAEGGHQLPTVTAAAVLPDEEKKNVRRRRCVIFAVVLVAILAVSIAVPLSRSFPNSSPTDIPATTPTPTMAPTTTAPTMTPSLPPVLLRQIGQDLVDGNPGDDDDTANFGKCLALSAEGDTVAVCGDDKVVVFRRNKQADEAERWNQLGQTLNLTGAFTFFGTALSLSGDGTLLAVARSGSADNVQVYRLEEAKGGNATDPLWTPLGEPLVGSAEFDDFGESVALSRDGTTLAVGAIEFNEGPGYVRVYHLNETSQQFIRNGNRVEGVQTLDEFGSSVALSENGTTLLVGSPQVRSGERDTTVPGYVRAFRLERSGRYLPFGQQIIGEITGDIANTGFGVSVSLSADGTILAAGGPNHDGNGNDSGYVQTFRFVDDNWVPLGGSILGESFDGFGHSVALSSDGMTLAVGDTLGELEEPNSTSTVVEERRGVSTIFRFDDIRTEWVEVGAVYGENVALSADGTVLATGDRFETSAVQVFEVVP